MSKEAEILQTFLIEYKAELNKKIDTVEAVLKLQIEKFYIDAHGMMEDFRAEFRGSMNDITTSIKEIVNKLNCHDSDITDLKNRMNKIEIQKKQEKDKKDQTKKTVKETLFYLFDRFAATILLAIILIIVTFFVNGFLIDKRLNAISKDVGKDNDTIEMNLHDE